MTDSGQIAELLSRWDDAAVWEFENQNTQAASTYDQCAKELRALFDSPCRSHHGMTTRDQRPTRQEKD